MSMLVLGQPFFAIKIATSCVGIWTPSDTWFLCRSPQAKQPLDRFSHLCRAHSLTDRPTDRPRYSVCSNRPHLARVVMLPRNPHHKHTLLLQIVAVKDKSKLYFHLSFKIQSPGQPECVECLLICRLL